MEDKIDMEKGRPPRFGLKTETDFNTNNSGLWNNLENGDKIWRLLIKSPGAKSINLLYDRFHLPPGAKLHIYNSNMTHIIGGFTEANNKGTIESPGMFATGLVYGDNVVLEYMHPKSASHMPVISIKGVVHGYKYIKLLDNVKNNESDEVYGGSGGCQVNVNCQEGNNWQDEKRGIAMLLINDGTRWCSGSLINTIKNDGTPYFLTANHCITEDGLDAGGNTNASQWIFYWDYETPNCTNPLVEPVINSTLGADLRANRADTDFALFELQESPIEAGFNCYFNGWTRTTNPGQNGVGIHHPGGDVKKISTHNMTPVNGQVYGPNHWRVNWIATANGHSVTEGGSSGSPLFTNNGLIIGQLHGGSNINCTDPANDPGEYGKLLVSWEGTSAIRRLKDWLGPSGFSVNGRYYCDNVTLSGPSQFCPSATYSVNVGDETVVNWSVTPSNAGTFSQNSSTTTFTRSGSFTGNATISTTLSGPCGNSTLTKQVTISGSISMSWAGPGPFGQVDVTVSGGSSPFKFYRNGSLIFTSSTSSTTIPFGCLGGVLKVEANTPCGVASISELIPAGCASFSYQVFPNPSSTEIFVEKNNNIDILQSSYEPVEPKNEGLILQLYDNNGNMVRNEVYHKNDIKNKLEISGLKKGIYFLHITDNTVREIHRVLVQ